MECISDEFVWSLLCPRGWMDRKELKVLLQVVLVNLLCSFLYCHHLFFKYILYNRRLMEINPLTFLIQLLYSNLTTANENHFTLV